MIHQVAHVTLTLSSLLPATKNHFAHGLYLMKEQEGPGLGASEESAPFHPAPTLGASLAAASPGNEMFLKRMETPLLEKLWRTLRKQRIKTLKEASHKRPHIV